VNAERRSAPLGTCLDCRAEGQIHRAAVAEACNVANREPVQIVYAVRPLRDHRRETGPMTCAACGAYWWLMPAWLATRQRTDA